MPNLMLLLFWCSIFVASQFLPHNHVDAKPSSTTAQRILHEVIPLEARDFYENLTSTDRQVLEKVLTKAPNYASFGEVLGDMRNGSTTLYDKTVGLVTGLRQTVAQLSPSARAFVDQSVEQINAARGQQFGLDMIKTQANVLVRRFRALEPTTKSELRSAFPIVAAIIDNPIVQTLASGLLNLQDENEVGSNGDGGKGGNGEGREGVEEEEFKMIKH